MSKNAAGASCAEEALKTYRERQGYSVGWQADIIDLMTDLLHLAQREGCDCAALAATADRHFKAERDSDRQAAGPAATRGASKLP